MDCHISGPTKCIGMWMPICYRLISFSHSSINSTANALTILFCRRRRWNILLTILFAAADIECHPHHSRRVHVCVATKDFKDRWLTTHKSRATQAYTTRHNAKGCGGMSHWHLHVSRQSTRRRSSGRRSTSLHQRRPTSRGERISATTPQKCSDRLRTQMSSRVAG